eukprot:CAMPEP_0171246550 /NCGR_PEP_ID=MMETSP0790-20130122/48012_1 /TAXON_ID=2925 /ORGANISM="Alexandrium catenella, Strain OF101" /LENGTH=33 /DNA_ID= /DNA_START= /DNA_END= /DNA_ORIENTATION=
MTNRRPLQLLESRASCTRWQAVLGGQVECSSSS